MTETTHDPAAPFPPPAPPPVEPPRLVRDPDDAVVAGVCAAFGRYTDTDPVLWRVTVAVLTLFGGAGLVLYALGWLLVPRVGDSESFAERTLRRPDRSGLSAAGVLLVVVAAVVLLAVLDDGPGLGALLVLAGVGYLVLRERRDPRTRVPGGYAYGPVPPSAHAPEAHGTAPHGTAPYDAPPYDTPPYDTPPYDTPPYDTPPYDTPPYEAQPYGTAPYGHPLPWDSPPPRARRPRSALGALTLSAATLLVGVLLALRLSGVESLTAPRILALALLVVGGGLLVGAWVGRARWLIPVGLVLALALGGTAAAERVGVQDGLGRQTWIPTSDASYALGAGEGVLDLRGLPARADVAVAAEVGLGSLTVLVPPGVRADVTAQAGVGEVSRTSLGGQRTVLSTGDETDVHEQFVVGSGDARVELDLEVGMGEIEVRRVAA